MQRQQCYHIEIEALREKIAGLERPGKQATAPAVSTGIPDLDRLLPHGGFRPGTVVEWLAHGEGAGAVTVALQTAREACRRGGALVVVDRTGEFYPPAAIGRGIEPEGLIVVRVVNQPDHTWALDQALRCEAVSAVLAWPDAAGGRLDGRAFRRLQLAAEEGSGLGLLIRSDTARNQPSWADVRMAVEPLASACGKTPTSDATPNFSRRRFRLELLRCRGGVEGRSVEVEVNDETYSLRVALGRGDRGQGTGNRGQGKVG